MLAKMYGEVLITDGSRYIFMKPLSLFYKNTRTDGSVDLEKSWMYNCSRYVFIKPLSLFYKNTRTDGSLDLEQFWMHNCSRYIFIKPLSLFYKNTRTDGSWVLNYYPRSSLRVFWLEEVVYIK
jgi:hypothetical protein